MANCPIHHVMCLFWSGANSPGQAYVLEDPVECLPAGYGFFTRRIEQGRVITQKFVGQGGYWRSSHGMYRPLHQARWR